ncbi:MAG: hypothetical protein FWE41_03445 [Coriobacteriia bacterium]|nr:hypothetical protein [Coriobacteriia bacterium]MCL2749714.1 hypothetical protein [Coriobacteriia bacterium]
MQKHTTMTLKNEGHSNIEVNRMTGISRKTIARYWNEYLKQLSVLGTSGDSRSVQELIIQEPRYDTSRRKPLKYSPEIDAELDAILTAEEVKKSELGQRNKQMLTTAEMHRILVDKGYEIGESTIRAYVRKKRERLREAFIRQEYDLACLCQ